MYQTLITAQQLANLLDHPSLAVIDCRFSLADPTAGATAYRQGHIPGARYAHLDHDLSSPITPTSGRHPLPKPDTLAQRLGHWGITPESQVVVYDDAGGSIAARLWWLLRWLGHTAVAVLDGGLPSWQRINPRLTTDPPEHPTQRYAAKENNALWLTTAQLQAALENRAILLMDARAEQRYRGDIEPIDPVAGHIPGAINRPFQHNLDDTGCFLSPDQLRHQIQRQIQPAAPENVVHMCGSGVTACHNLLAMDVAGLTGSRLYAGSWSEWIHDSQRPIAIYY